MSYRNHKTHKTETAAIKAALKAAGLPVLSVRHDRGTASGWLKITLANHDVPHDVHRCDSTEIVKMTRAQIQADHEHRWACVGNCDGCIEYWKRYRQALRIAVEVTGRDDDSKINVYMS